MKPSLFAIVRTTLKTKKSCSMKMVGVILAFCLAAAIASPAQVKFTTLATFRGTNGGGPSALVQATDGNFHGTTFYGGTNNEGTVFRITPKGKLTTLYSFCVQLGCPDGYNPGSGLVQGPDGNFYGTTESGGAANSGTAFTITTNGKLTTLYSFCILLFCADGYLPVARLLPGQDGNFYGTTGGGGVPSGSCPTSTCGTVFKMTPEGKLTTLHSFKGSDGGLPDGKGPLIPTPDGQHYLGTVPFGGKYSNNSLCSPQGFGFGCGVLYAITPAGALTVLHNFNGTDGSYPVGGLVRGCDGNFYGTTTWGGANTECKQGCGTVFRITPGGKLTTLHSFAGYPSEGNYPYAGLIRATDGNFYGTTEQGGAAGFGTIFKITPKGKLTTLHNFTNTDGSGPFEALLQGTDGNFYGQTSFGGDLQDCKFGCGTIFKLSVGLGPFVTSQTYSGKVGAKVTILGTNLTGATGVKFHRTAAQFSVVSPSEITATVPTGATTGRIQVTTPGGVLTSNTPFYVTR
jgi:uncharacterized repeat protein (TIGR03803 family)